MKLGRRAPIVTGPSSLSDAANFLNHPDQCLRQRALALLEKSPGVEGLPQILAHLDSFVHDDRDLQGRMLDGVATEEMLTKLRSPDTYVRRRALKALMKDEGALMQHTQALVQLLEDTDSWVRCLALEAFSQLRNIAAFGPAIARLLEDDAAWVRRAAADALGTMPQSQLSQFAEALAHRMDDPNWQVRRCALEALQNLDPAELRKFETAIVPVQADSDELVSDAAAQAVATMYAPGGFLEAELCAHFESLREQLQVVHEPSEESIADVERGPG